MDEGEIIETKAMVQQWQKSGALLDSIRCREIRETDTELAIHAFRGLPRWIVERDGIRTTTGLLEFYKKLNRG